jgi:hypothetical protein
MFELVEFREPVGAPLGDAPIETVLGTFDEESDAIIAGRDAWKAHRATASRDVVWWLVRLPGESLARWIADSASPTERMLDLTTNRLVEIP